MKKLRFKDFLLISKYVLRSENALDQTILSFFNQRHKGRIQVIDQGRSALQLAIEDFSLKDSEVIVPSFICSDVFTNLFIQNNITPKIIDCRPGSLHIHLDDVKKAISSKTRAVVIVHTYGIPNDPTPFKKLCASKNLILIEDCAHSIDLKFKGSYLGSYGDASIFSFVKEMPNFLGGTYINNHKQLPTTRKLPKRRLSKEDFLILINKLSISQLLRKAKSSVSNAKISNPYTLIKPGLMPKLAKAIFCSKISHLDIAQKRTIALKLNSQLPNGISAITDKQIKISSAKCFPFFVKNKNKVLRRLEKNGFNPGRGWVPSFSTNSLAKKNWKLPKTPVTERYEQELINLDLDEITESNLRKVIEIVSSE